MAKWKLLAIMSATIVFVAIPIVAWTIYEGPLRGPEAAFRDFASASHRAEIQLTDPLVLAGAGVLPLVHEAIKDKNFRLRRYAIGHLGCARYAAALPTHERILADVTERDYFRADALEAVWLISTERGHYLAQPLLSAGDVLGRAGRDLVTANHQFNCRTWFEAFTGFKD